MKATHVVRLDAGLYYGGGEIQAERTRDALIRAGVEVEEFSPTQRTLGDVVHFFGNFDYFDDIASHARRLGVPYFVSPIFVSPRTEGRLRFRSVRQRTLGQFPKASKRLLEGAEALITLTQHEEDSITAYFGDGLPPVARIPNGVEERFAQGDGQAFRDRFGILEPFAIHLGTIDRSKNQRGSIRACKGLLPLVIIGRESDPDYAASCRTAGDSSVHFLGTFPHGDPILADALAAATVFILPSYRELFPLSALEATVAGCHLVLSNRWSGEDIWGEDATFVDPDKHTEVRNAVAGALAKDRARPDRTQRYLDRFSWDSVAVQIRDLYKRVLDKTA